MTKYLTNREAAQALLDGKNLLWRGVSGAGSRIDLLNLDDETDGYTLVPQTITRTITYPKPESVAPQTGQKYWVPSAMSLDYRESFAWHGDSYCHSCLSRGLVHLTREAAIAHAKALIGGAE